MKGTPVIFASLPVENFKGAQMYDPRLKAITWVLQAAFGMLRDYIERFQQGTWPDPDLMIQNTLFPAETDLEFSCEDERNTIIHAANQGGVSFLTVGLR